MTDAMKLLRELMDRLGMSAAEAWPHVVEHVRLSAWTRAWIGFGWAIAAVPMTLLGLLMLRWGARVDAAKQQEKYYSWSEIRIVITVCACALLACACGALLGGLCGGVSWLPDALEPTGAAIRGILGK